LSNLVVKEKAAKERAKGNLLEQARPLTRAVALVTVATVLQKVFLLEAVL